MHKTVILPLVSYGSEAWSSTLREEHRPTVFENSVLRKIFGYECDEEQESEEDYVTRNLQDQYLSSYIIRLIKSEKMGLAGEHVWGREEVDTGVGEGNLRERDHLEDHGVSGRIILRWIFRKWVRGNGLG